jgi:glycosyltransferase involved in cell wall biosynthesis
MILPVYILIRTSNRPKFFHILMKTINRQTYPNIKTIVHTDNNNDKYVRGDIIVRGRPQPQLGRGFYNLYNNSLLKAIPEGPGWFVFIDDDDMYFSSNVIEKFVNASKPDHINVARADRGGGRIWPKYWKNQNVFQTECFMLHTQYKNMSRWPAKKGGDHAYTRVLTKKLPINWIEGLIVTKAQAGKGRGLRLDKGQKRR